jgi:glucose/arabinose dehydrogenase
VQPREKVAMYEQLGIGGMVRMNLDGSGREVVARGVRNSVGMDINPKDKTVWFTDNQTDGMGDNIPPGELNRITKAGGEHFGHP